MEPVYLATEHHGERAVFSTCSAAFDFIVDASFGSFDQEEIPPTSAVCEDVEKYGYWSDDITGECSIERLNMDCR
jgi:hypothetical protein